MCLYNNDTIPVAQCHVVNGLTNIVFLGNIQGTTFNKLKKLESDNIPKFLIEFEDQDRYGEEYQNKQRWYEIEFVNTPAQCIT